MGSFLGGGARVPVVAGAPAHALGEAGVGDESGAAGPGTPRQPAAGAGGTRAISRAVVLFDRHCRWGKTMPSGE
eukprot:1265523-Alexandrium_andersonii.AAC.1